jgi:long-chain acyl-CoA synthetase
MLTHTGCLLPLEAEAEALALTSDDVYLWYLSHGTVGISWGFSCSVLGVPMLSLERYLPDEYRRLVREYQVTVLSGMPPVIHALTETPIGNRRRVQDSSPDN